MSLKKPNDRTTKAHNIFLQVVKRLEEEVIHVHDFKHIGSLDEYFWNRDFGRAGYSINISIEECRISEWHRDPNSFQIRLRRSINYLARTASYKVKNDGSFNLTALKKKLTQYIEELIAHIVKQDPAEQTFKMEQENLLALAGEDFTIFNPAGKPEVIRKIDNFTIGIEQANSSEGPTYLLSLGMLTEDQLKAYLAKLR